MVNSDILFPMNREGGERKKKRREQTQVECKTLWTLASAFAAAEHC